MALEESCVSGGVRKPGNVRVTDRHDMNLAVKVVLNLNTTNQRKNWTLHKDTINPLPDDKILERSKLKKIAGDI